MKEQWEFEDDCDPEGSNMTCQVCGTGKYRFNQYGTDGFAWRQFRFKTKDDAMEYLGDFARDFPLRRVKPDQPQYQVMVWDGKNRCRKLRK